ncbi:MAG: radical SAM protein [Nitrosopumilaceae archaeon]
MTQATKDVKPNATYFEVRSPDLEWPKYRSPEYWEYRRKWSEYPKRMYVSDFPLNLDIETTNICNLACPMCSRTIQINDGTYVDIGTMSMDIYKKIIDEGAENGLCAVKLNYLGEPLADRYIVDRIKYAKARGIIEVMFNTNASLLTEEKSIQLLEAGLDSIFFSVDGILPETFNKIRIGTDYETVVTNIKNFVRIKNEGNYKHVQTRVSMVVLPGMEKEAEEYTKFWLPILGQVGFGEWVDHRGKGTTKDDHSREIIYDDYNPDFVCAQPFQRMFIMYDGVCTPCCPDVSRGYVVGDIKNQTIKEIWHGERYGRLREAQINGRYRDIDICRSCYMPFSQKDTKM